jgi:sulfane dehydrogenase subunit SoxC
MLRRISAENSAHESKRMKGSSRRGFLIAGSGFAALAAVPKAWGRELGEPVRPYGERSPFEKSQRFYHQSPIPATAASGTPLQDSYGIITPSSLHFESHHSGVPQIDPAKHELLIHGAVERPLVLKLEDLQRFSSVSRIHFIECAGNTAGDLTGNPRPNVQRSHGLVSCSEWTGVTLATLLQEVSLKRQAKWILAEGADACRMARSIPMDKALDDVIVAYGQNGEALRPEQGYPIRLVVPGWEGNVHIKWLHRLHLVDQPSMTREEAAGYTDLMPDGKARMFTFVMEAKSVITRPSGEQNLPGPGFYEITGLAWTGRGRIERVEISTDGGRLWQAAELQEPRLAKAFTRFRLPWTWDGTPTTLQSRCTDETGYVQPTHDELLAVRGKNSTDHYNGIKVWRVLAGGRVTHV